MVHIHQLGMYTVHNIRIDGMAAGIILTLV